MRAAHVVLGWQSCCEVDFASADRTISGAHLLLAAAKWARRTRHPSLTRTRRRRAARAPRRVAPPFRLPSGARGAPQEAEGKVGGSAARAAVLLTACVEVVGLEARARPRLIIMRSVWRLGGWVCI